ncbi:MAG: hypothetical protein ACODAC_11965, partial [Pseudomonadota bacterium]
MTLGAGPTLASDVRILVDVSVASAEASAERNDALSMLFRLLPESGRAGVWSYADRVETLVEHGPSDGLWQETAALRMRDAGSGARRADLLAALERATRDRAAHDAAPVHVLVVTHSGLDAGDAAADRTARERLLTELLPELERAGFAIHTLALSTRADVNLLAQISARTGGYHGRLHDAAGLPDELVDLLGRLGPAGRLPVAEDGTFRVPPGAKELTVVNRHGQVGGAAVLVGPGGERFRRTTPRRRVRWHLGEDHELITLPEPAPGQWRLEEGTDGVEVVAYGDLELTVPDLPGTLFPGDLRSFELRVASSGQPVRDRDFLDLLEVRARLHGPEGEVPLVVEPADEPGRYRVHLLELHQRGRYRVEARLWGPTFEHVGEWPVTVEDPLHVQLRPSEQEVAEILKVPPG